MGKVRDLKGLRFGRLIVIGFSGLNKHRKATWNCLCDCGNKVVVVGSSLTSGATKSCGCYEHETKQKRNVTHGLRKHELYKTWLNIKARCYNPNNNHYKYYGGKGIGMCDEWKGDFKLFYDWAISNGWKCGLSIERIDNKVSYKPSNCKWINMNEQSKNRTTNHYLIDKKGNVFSIADVSRITSINAHTLYACYNKNKSILPTLYLRGVYDYMELDSKNKAAESDFGTAVDNHKAEPPKRA